MIENVVISKSGWYSPQQVSDMGVVLGLGYAGIYNLISEKDPISGSRIARKDDDRLVANEVSKSSSSMRRYKILGSDLVDFLKKHKLPIPKIIK